LKIDLIGFLSRFGFFGYFSSVFLVNRFFWTPLTHCIKRKKDLSRNSIF
jgi:hypothetical protein